MSHEATNWAIKQRGLKPTTKIVLWHLCDRYNPDYGCFPSQVRLAHDCEISRSTLNDHLSQLEAGGLLRRVPRLDPVTKRQLSTRYILGFEPGFTPVDVLPCPDFGHGGREGEESSKRTGASSVDEEADARPCPEFGHGIDAEAVSEFRADPCPENLESRVRNPDTNLVREPLREPVKEEEDAQAREDDFEAFFADLLGALGFSPEATLPAWWQGWPARVHVRRWRHDLGLTEADIISTAEASRQNHVEPPDGPKALDRVMERAARRNALVAEQKVRGARGSAGAGQESQQRRQGAPLPRPSADSIAEFYADLVNSDRYLPVSAISNRTRDAMLARGLVTADRLRERGVR